jgi:hypothetical protein
MPLPTLPTILKRIRASQNPEQTAYDWYWKLTHKPLANRRLAMELAEALKDDSLYSPELGVVINALK